MAKRKLDPAMKRFVAISYTSLDGPKIIGRSQSMAGVVRIGREAITQGRTAFVEVFDAKRREMVDQITR